MRNVGFNRFVQKTVTEPHKYMLYFLFIFSIIASLLSTVGFNVLRISALHPKNSWNQLFLMLFAFFLQAVGVGFDIASLQFGPQNLKAVLSSLPILINPFIVYSLSCFLPKNQKTKTEETEKGKFCPHYILDFCALSFLALGLVITSLSFILYDAFTDYYITPDDTFALVTSPKAIVFQVFLGICGLVCVTFFAFSSCNYCVQKTATLSIASGFFDALGSLCIKNALQMLGSDKTVAITIFSYIGIVSCLIYVSVLLHIASLYDANTSSEGQITLFTITYITSSMLSGGVVYEEFSTFDFNQWLIFGTGICFTFLALAAWGMINKKK